MKKLLTILFCFIVLCVKSQNVRVIKINDGFYPEISLRVKAFPNNNDTFYVTENSLTLPCKTVETDSSEIPSGKNFIFLVENSYFFQRSGIFNEIKRTLLDITNNLNADDKINILYFGTPGRTVKYLNTSLTEDFKRFNFMTADYFRPQTDSSFIENELISALEESLNFASEVNSDSPTILTLISRGLNLSEKRNFSPEYENLLKNSDIYFNALIYETESQNCTSVLKKLCLISKGNFFVFKEDSLEPVVAQIIEKSSKAVSKKPFKNFLITFNATQKGSSNVFSLNYGNEKIFGEYSYPIENGFFYKYPAAAAGLTAFLIIAVGVIFYYRIRLKILRRIDEAAQTKIKDVIKENKNLKRDIQKYKRYPQSISRSLDELAVSETIAASGKMIPKLLVNDGEEKFIFDLTKTIMTIGRKDTNDIVINNRTVSSNHAALSFEGGVFYITDNNSTNGTFVNDLKVTKSKIYPDDILRLGAVFAKINF